MAGWVLDIGVSGGVPFVTELLDSKIRTGPIGKTTLSNRSRVRNRSLLKTELDLSQLRPTSEADKGAWPLLATYSAKQNFFVVEDGDVQFHLPTQALAYALVPLHVKAFGEVWSAAGLDGVVEIEEGAERTLFASYRTQLGPTTEKVNNHLLWLTGYPSTRRMIGSFHTSILRGRLDIAFPKVKVSIELFGTKYGKRALVHHCFVDWYEPLEEPFRGIRRLGEPRFQLAHDFPTMPER